MAKKTKNESKGIRNYRSDLDRQMKDALKKEARFNFQESISGVGKTANNLMNMAEKVRISSVVQTGKLQSKTYSEISKNISEEFKSHGITAFKDKGGKTWDIDNYANMVARTNLAEASRQGMINQLQQNDLDLVQVTTHFGACPLCEPWEASILSISGNTKRLYGTSIETVDTAKSKGLFHPNCGHRIVPFDPKFAANSYAWSIRNQEYVYSVFAQPKMSWKTMWQLFINWVKFNEAGFANIAELKRNYVPKREGEDTEEYNKRVNLEASNPVKKLLPEMERAVNSNNLQMFNGIIDKWKEIGTEEAIQYAKQHEKMRLWLFPK